MRASGPLDGKANLIGHARRLDVSMPRDLAGVDAQVRAEGTAAVDVAAELRDVLAPALRVMR
jgi:hypothetical protein